jgi:hypothetical protein
MDYKPATVTSPGVDLDALLARCRRLVTVSKLRHEAALDLQRQARANAAKPLHAVRS